jgi:cation-transporting ATPase 13A3/4/5
LRAGADIGGNTSASQAEAKSDLHQLPSHIVVVSPVVEETITWQMYVRRAEEAVMYAVHEWYLISWCVAVLSLLLLTAAFTVFSRSIAPKDESEKICKPFEFVPTGDSEDMHHLEQKGYGHSLFGGTIFWLWVLLPFLGYVQMGLIALDHYFFALHQPDLTWSQWAQPYLLVFILSHLALYLQTQFIARARVFFMLPAPLDTAKAVLIQDPQSPADDELVTVEMDSETSTRFFEYTCIRYVWREAEGRFTPVGHEEGVNGVSAVKRVSQGGLNKEELAEKAIVGDNVIHVPVPGIFASLGDEFLTPLYCFQFAVMWLYLFIDSWNISAVWLVWTFTAGISKSLFSVRKNKQKIADMAKTESQVHVKRGGEWQEISSKDVVPGDIIRIEEGKVCCDMCVVEGGAVVNESMLTGEPMPVQRFPIESSDTTMVSSKTHKKHFIFTGTIVMQSSGDNDSNHGVGIVVNTGPMTMKGSLVRTVLFPEPIQFKFTDQLPWVYLIMFIYVCILFTIVQFFSNTGSWVYGIYIGFTILAQSLNPLMPVSITLGQTVGAEKLKADCDIKCLSPQRLPIAGKVHVMVMDKTGTITKEGMDFRGAHIAKDGKFIEPVWVEEDDETSRCNLDTEKLPDVIKWALAACHTVTKMRNGDLVGNMVEVSQVGASGWTLSDDSKKLTKTVNGSESEIKILKQLEFDQTRVTSGAVIEVNGRILCLIKGSYEKIENLSKFGLPKDYKDVTEQAAADQYYVLGIGMKEMKSDWAGFSRADLEQGLTFAGLFLFRNEMKVDSPLAVSALREGGVRSVMCTGDNALTGAAIAKTCGMTEETADQILGDISEKSDTIVWTLLPSKTTIAEEDIKEKYPNAELVLTKAAFRKLEERLKVDRELIGRVRVYARMKPDDKVAVVNAHQAHCWVVGMVGDGGNDCGAMRAAHVGLALSDAEAAIVAPFSSGNTYGTTEKSLRAVPDLLRYGRATLQTNLGTFLFYTCYGLCLPSSKLIPLLLFASNMAEWDWLFIDIFLGAGFVMLMTSSSPSEKLAPLRPTAALLESRTVSTIALHVGSFLVFFCISLKILWVQPFYVEYHTTSLKIPSHEWPKKGDNFDCAICFLVLSTQLVTAGYAGCLGAEHRQNVLRNWRVTLAFVVFMVFLIVLVIGGPSELHCIFRTNCDSRTSRTMYVPFVQEFSAGNVGGCFLGPQLEAWAEELGDRYEFPDKDANKCFPAPGFDPEEKLSVPSGALFGLGKTMCFGPNNCFDKAFDFSSPAF